MRSPNADRGRAPDSQPMPGGGWLLIAVLVVILATAIYVALRFYGLR